MYILIKGQGLEWHMYFFTNQLDYNYLFIYLFIWLMKLYNINQNGQWFLIKWNMIMQASSYQKYNKFLLTK